MSWVGTAKTVRRVRPSASQTGGILFELVLAMSLFTGAAAFTLAAVRNVFTTLDQISRRQQAIDLARSKLSELEAGLINLADLRDGTSLGSGSGQAWKFDLKTTRSEFTDLS